MPPTSRPNSSFVCLPPRRRDENFRKTCQFLIAKRLILAKFAKILRIFLKKVIVTPTCRFDCRYYLIAPKSNQNKNFNKCPFFLEMSEANRDRSYDRAYDRSYDRGHMTGATLIKYNVKFKLYNLYFSL